MKYIILLIIILFCNSLFAQQKEYKLVQYSENSDIDIELFKKFDYIPFLSMDSIEQAFKPIKGKYKVYSFIATYKGESFDGTTKIFHDYLILKVDPISNIIIDGCQYTYEWADPPPMVDLYRVSVFNVKLKDRIKINNLKMKLFDKDYESDREYLIEDGIILLE